MTPIKAASIAATRLDGDKKTRVEPGFLHPRKFRARRFNAKMRPSTVQVILTPAPITAFSDNHIRNYAICYSDLAFYRINSVFRFLTITVRLLCIRCYIVR